MSIRFALTPLVLALLAQLAPAQTVPINECGTVVQAVSCVMFQSDSGGLYVFDPSGCQVGDYVQVNGMVDPGCFSTCQQGNGCIQAGAAVSPCGPGTMFCGNPGFPQLPTACPCSNFGDYAHGCANSVDASGALVVATGTLAPDGLVLSASRMPPAATCIFFQGDGLLPNGVLFGDGTRCVDGQLLRLAVLTAAGGAAQYPGAGDPSITARCAQLGAPIPPSSVRGYQTYYRDPSATFCPAPAGSTFNASNAIEIFWP